MLNRVLEEVGHGFATATGSSWFSGALVGEEVGSRAIPAKSLAEMVRMLERRGAVVLYCGAVGFVDADIEDIGTVDT